MTKSNMGREWFACLALHIVHHQRMSGQELKWEEHGAGVDAEAIQESCLWFVLHGLLSYRVQDHQLRDGPTHNGQSPSPSVTN